MCGVAGVVHLEGSPLDDPSRLMTTLDQALAHRGPDGSGAWLSPDGAALLVHRRLAIIDPSPDGAQPMATADGRFVIVFNGEVYNFRDIRADLEGRGERFRTSSDTEVLLRLIARDGPDALARVRGMFALACWDGVERSLLVARDRFGVKPLYISVKSDTMSFASELNALRAAGLVDASPSPAGVLAFLSWGSVPPPLTWMQEAQMLPAGTWREWRRGGKERSGVFADTRNIYRTIDHSGAEPRRDLARWRQEVGNAVRDSVRAHLVADVPVGVFLSGGIDSGALVSAASSVGATNLETFTVGFDDRSSEDSYARIVAERFGTRHHELRVDAGQIAADLPGILKRLDQPTIDAVNSFCISRAVASTGIKAVLSGAGGDELFGGYPSFRRLPRSLAVKRLAGPAWPLIAMAGRLVAPARLQQRWSHFASTNGSAVEAYRVQRGFLLPQEIARNAGPRLTDASVRPDADGDLQSTERLLLSQYGDERPLATVARLESRMYLQSQLLRDLDAMAMANGLEVRVPLVDHPLASAVWPELGRHAELTRGKALLYESLDSPLPRVITTRRKQGFTLPFARWMRGELAPFVREGLDRLSAGGWLVSDAPARVWADWVQGRAHWSRPWGLGVLGHFLDAA